MGKPRKKPEVLVFEAEAKSALPVAESFAKQGFRVVAASSRRYCAAYYSRAVQESVRMPSEVTNPEDCLDFLLDITRKRRFEMIVPLGDLVNELVCRKRDTFCRYTKLALVPYEIFHRGRSKIETLKAAKQCGVPTPETWYPCDEDIDEIAEKVTYPVLVKPAIANGARGIHLVHGADELRQRYEEVQAAFGETFVQEFIPHEGMQYKVDIVLDRAGSLLAGVAYSKIRYYPPSGGSSVLNETVHRPDLIEYATRLAGHLGWYGLCDFDFIEDVRDRTPKIMEINPRFPESFRMCQVAGVDFPKILYHLACGENVKATLDYKVGRYLRFLPGDLMWFLTARGRQRRTRPSFFRFFDADTTYQIVSLRDPGPIIGYFLENLSILLNSKERAFRFRMDAARQTSKVPTSNA